MKDKEIKRTYQRGKKVKMIGGKEKERELEEGEH